MRRVLINCELHPKGLEFLKSAGYESVCVPEDDPSASLREAPSCVGLVANASLRIDGEFFDAAPSIRVVGRVGVGYDNVDVDAATERGVRVVHTPLPVVEPVAEHALALMLALAREIVSGDRAVRAGLFRSGAPAPSVELRGKTLGLVGLGRTGMRLAEIAHRGLDMTIVYVDKIARPRAEGALHARRLDLDRLLASSDVVSLHVNLDDSTRHLIDDRALDLMKPGAFLINVARGPVVDEAALLRALEAGRLGGAGLDVFEVEPPPADHPLFSRPDVVVAPHRGGFSAASVEGCARVVEDIDRIIRGEEPRYPVNRPRRS